MCPNLKMLQFTNSASELPWPYSRGHKIRENAKTNVTCHPSGFRFNGEDDIPVSKSVQLMVPSEDAE